MTTARPGIAKYFRHGHHTGEWKLYPPDSPHFIVIQPEHLRLVADALHDLADRLHTEQHQDEETL